MDLFLSSTCTVCQQRQATFRKMEKNYPWLQVTSYYIDKDKQALIQFSQLLGQQKNSDFAVPAVFFCNSRWVGFDPSQGKDLLPWLLYCKKQIEKEGKLSETSVQILQYKARADSLESQIQPKFTSVRYLTVLPLMDALNSCVLFCFISFFVLLLMKASWREQLLSGACFLFVVGVVHFIQGAAMLSFFELLPWLRFPLFLIGLLTFHMAGAYPRVSNTLWYLWIGLFAGALQTYQSTCWINWSYVFQNWLVKQDLSTGKAGLYQLVYQVMYLLPLLLLFPLCSGLMQSKFLAKFKQRLRLVLPVYLRVVALFFIFYPLALANTSLSLFILFVLFLSVIWRSCHDKKPLRS